MMLYILLLALGLSGSIGLQLDSNDKSPCTISFPYTTPHVNAFYEQTISGTGCSTNATMANSSQEVHVINLLNAGPMYRNDVAEVNLLIKSRTNEVIWEPIIFVLSSQQPVRWKVKTEIMSPPRRRHVFVVPRYSGVRLVKSHRKRVIRKIDDLPHKQGQLLKWVNNEYKAITSFTELKRGNRIELTVGLEQEAPPICEVKKDPPQPLNAIASYEQPQLLSGCDVGNSLSNNVAYVIELKKVNADPKKQTVVEVDLDIKSSSRRTVQRDFWLVLKSPGNVSWKVTTKKIQGYIDIIANSFVDMANIRMDTVGVRREDIQHSREDLITWVEYYIGAVSMYVEVNIANKIKLVLPETDNPEKETLPEKVKPIPVFGAFENKEQTKVVFSKAVHVECQLQQQQEHMIVVFSWDLARNFGLKLKQVTLLDTDCDAAANKTHVILGMRSNKCGTKTIIKDGKRYFTNALLIHPEGGQDIFEEPGSGNDEEISGSGSHDSYLETYFDDEDIQRPTIRINLECEVPFEEVVKPVHVDSLTTLPPHVAKQFEVDLYRTSTYDDIYYSFPIEVAYNSRVYGEITIKPEYGKQVQIRSCWLSQTLDKSEERVMLVEDGCKKDQNFEWHQEERRTLFNQRDSQRFSFIPGKHFKIMFLKCQVIQCRKVDHIDQNKDQHIPLCIMDMECSRPEKLEISSAVPNRLVTAGPMKILDKAPVVIKNKDKVNVTFLPRRPVSELPKKEPQKPAVGDTIIVEGLDSATVVGIAFAAFIIGVLLMAALWFIHTHTGPIKHAVASTRVLDGSGESTPMSTAPITINT